MLAIDRGRMEARLRATMTSLFCWSPCQEASSPLETRSEHRDGPYTVYPGTSGQQSNVSMWSRVVVNNDESVFQLMASDRSGVRGDDKTDGKLEIGGNYCPELANNAEVEV